MGKKTRKRSAKDFNDLTKFCHAFAEPKRRHASKEDAARAMSPIYAKAKRRPGRSSGKLPGVFHCHWCSSWHIGRKPSW